MTHSRGVRFPAQRPVPITCITYRDVLYKYRLLQDNQCQTQLRPEIDLRVPGDWVVLSAKGLLSIKSGYQWDGPSGPTIDTKTFMRGSLVHDGLYQLLREGLLGARDSEAWEKNRRLADLELVEVCKLDGMNWLRRAWVFRALRWGGRSAALPDKPVEICMAPNGCQQSTP